MKRISLTRPPDFLDSLGRPTYRVAQERGLWDDMSEELLSGPTAAGYSAAADEAIFACVAAELRRLARDRPIDVLEIGGGTGHFFDRVRDITRSYVNVEPGDPRPDPGMIARLDDPSYAAVRCTAEAIPIPSQSADAALAIASLDHIPDHRAALAEFERCLRPGGMIVVVLNNAASWWKRLLRGTRFMRSREARIAADHFVQWSAAECAAELARHFTDVRTRTIRYVPYVPVLWRILAPGAEVVGARLAPLRGGDIIATARARNDGVQPREADHPS